MRRLVLLVCLLTVPLSAVALGAPTPAGAQGGLALSPSSAEGVAVPGQRLGPFGILNTTEQTYATKVSPVLLGQNRDGGLFVRQDPASLKRARRLLRVAGDAGFSLRPGGSRSVAGRLVRRSAAGNFYGGVLFRGTPPAPKRGSGVVPVLQLNARLFLRPPPARRRTRARLTALRAEQTGPRRLRALVGLVNAGNTDIRPRGRLTVRDGRGDVRVRSRIKGFEVLPEAEVDLRADLGAEVLPAGRYTMQAAIKVGGRTLRLERPLVLFGPNEVATTRAEITSFEPPPAESGEEAEVAVRYRNTGNVPVAPRVQLRVTGVGSATTLDAGEVAAGASGEATGSTRLEGVQPRQLTVRLLAGNRQLDASTVTVTPVEKRSLGDRLGDWLAENAIAVIAVLLGLVLAMGAVFATLALRRRRQRKQ